MKAASTITVPASCPRRVSLDLELPDLADDPTLVISRVCGRSRALRHRSSSLGRSRATETDRAGAYRSVILPEPLASARSDVGARRARPVRRNRTRPSRCHEALSRHDSPRADDVLQIPRPSFSSLDGSTSTQGIPRAVIVDADLGHAGAAPVTNRRPRRWDRHLARVHWPAAICRGRGGFARVRGKSGAGMDGLTAATSSRQLQYKPDRHLRPAESDAIPDRVGAYPPRGLRTG